MAFLLLFRGKIKPIPHPRPRQLGASGSCWHRLGGTGPAGLGSWVGGLGLKTEILGLGMRGEPGCGCCCPVWSCAVTATQPEGEGDRGLWDLLGVDGLELRESRARGAAASSAGIPGMWVQRIGMYLSVGKSALPWNCAGGRCPRWASAQELSQDARGKGGDDPQGLPGLELAESRLL